MKKSLPQLKLLFVFAFIIALFSFIPYFAGPGLTEAEPIGRFLNGNFPSEPLEAKPYRKAFPNLTFDSPITFNAIPNSNRIVIGQRDGKIFSFENDETTTNKSLVADFSYDVGTPLDGGFLGTAVHPRFGESGKNYLYMWYSTRDSLGGHQPHGMASGFGCTQEEWFWGNHLVLKRIELDPTTYAMIPNSELTMIQVRMYGSTHRGGGMLFGDDGFLYLTTGEQTGYARAQNLENNIDGGVLRIDVDMNSSKSHPPIRKMQDASIYDDEFSGVGYYIPNDNPFLSPDGSAYEEYFTIGHRNPYRMTKDRATGTLYIGEVGESNHEEINVVQSGANYGWPVFEGNDPGPVGAEGCTTLYNDMVDTKPLVSFPRQDANSLIGGYVYNGTEVPSLKGKYVCADFGVGEEIWSVDTTTGNYSLLTQFSPTDIISFGEDHSGELYLLSYGDGVSLYRITEPQIDSSEIPTLLSETGIFSDVINLIPSDGVLPYDMVEPFWSDGGLKRRWFSVPNDGTYNSPEEQIQFTENGDWEFPIGSVLVKHFDFAIDERDPSILQRLETRIEVRATDGSYYYLLYKWNEAGTDAVLLDGGYEEDIVITQADGSTRNQTWYYPSRQQCYECHGNFGVLGPATRYLNTDETYKTGVTANQLVTFSYLGLIEETITDEIAATYQTHKASDDPNASLEERARSYLDLNCAYCHRPGRSGDRAAFDLRLFNTLEQTGLLTAEANTPIYGVSGTKIIEPGNAAQSLLYHRTNSIDPTIMMPPLGKSVIDVPGTALVEEWINSLTNETSTVNIPEADYIITNIGSDKVIDIAGASLDPVADIIQYTNNANPSQEFTITKDGEYYSIQSSFNNFYFDTEGDGQGSGTNVVQYYGNGNDNQLWKFEDVGDNQFAIKNKSNGHYLGVENNSDADAASVKTYYNDGSDYMRWTLTPVSTIVNVTGVSVTPTSANLVEGQTLELIAEVSPANASDKTVSWSSNNELAATVDANGNVEAIAPGSATITVTTNDGGFIATVEITVEANVIPVTGISVTPTSTNLMENETVQLTAEVSPANASDKTVSWSSDNEAVATVDANGNTEAIAPGSATITVTTNDGGFTAASELTVEAIVVPVTGISVTPTNANLVEGQFLELIAEVSPANASDKTVSWSSDNEAVATVDTNGNVVAIAPGSATITVTTNDGGFTAASELTVEAIVVPVTGISVTPTNANLVEGETVQLTAEVSPSNASDKTVSWSSDNENVAIVDVNGNVEAIAPGLATITVTTNDSGFTATAEITVEAIVIPVTGISVTPTNANLVEGQTLEIIAEVSPANASNTDVSWSSNNENVATVDANGNVEAIAPGSATITVTTNDGGFSATTEITVEANVIPVTGISVIPTNANLVEGQTLEIIAEVSPANASNKTVSWSSDNENVAIVDANGNVEAIAPGLATITVTTNDGGFIATMEITVEANVIPVTGISVTPTNANLVEGQILELTAELSPTNASDKTVSWSSNNEAVATVDVNGNVVAIAPGSATITVITNDRGFTATMEITVEEQLVNVVSIGLSAEDVELYVGETTTLIATIYPENASDKAVVWQSTDETIATIDEFGLVSAIAEGVATIRATTNDGNFTAEALIKVMEQLSNELIIEPSFYPNPTTGILILDVRAYRNQEVSITIFNELQQLVYQNKLMQTHSETEEIRVSDFADGVYYIVFETDDTREGKIFILKK